MDTYTEYVKKPVEAKVVQFIVDGNCKSNAGKIMDLPNVHGVNLEYRFIEFGGWELTVTISWGKYVKRNETKVRNNQYVVSENDEIKAYYKEEFERKYRLKEE